MNKREIDVALRKVANGDNVAFEQLYQETKRGVFAFLYSYCNNFADCEDALQIVYLKVKQNVSQYTPGSNGLAWILQIAKNTALNQLRSKAQAEKFSAATTKEPCTHDDLELRSALFVIMRRVLDEEENRIVILHVVWQYKHREIAQLLNCPVGTVTSKYKRAVQKIKLALKEEQQ